MKKVYCTENGVSANRMVNHEPSGVVSAVPLGRSVARTGEEEQSGTRHPQDVYGVIPVKHR